MQIINIMSNKYDKLKKEYSILKQKYKKIETIANKRSFPYDMYEQERNWYTNNIEQSLGLWLTYHQNILDTITPHSYQEIYHKTLPHIKENSVEYYKCINSYLNYCNTISSYQVETPIWILTKQQYNNDILMYNEKLMDKYNILMKLLHTDSWSVSLDNITKLIRQNTITWIEHTIDTIHLINDKLNN